MSHSASYSAFLDRLGGVNDLLNALSILQWDSRTMMPPGGVMSRARQIATLLGAAREKLLSDETRRVVDAAMAEVSKLPAEAAERRSVEQTVAAIAFHERIPAALQTERAELKTIANAAWIKARADSDFAAFAPYLERVVDLARRTADAIGYADHPYDALVAIYEPGETKRSLDALFGELRRGIGPILAKVLAAPEPKADFLERHFPRDRQFAVARRLAETIGYDFQRGRLDDTVHPFEISFTRDDVRITTRFYENYLPPSVFGALHEAGHGIYEQGVDPVYTRSPLATDLVGWYAVGGTSFGAHESQSRLYENHVGRSRRFWELHFGVLRDAFPEALADVDAEAFFRAVNRIRPGLIRVEADELTYDYHIMLRVEIEAALMDGSLKVADLPAVWNETIRRELGVAVPDDRRGVLQDIHWSTCQIGTFCNYTIGNVMAAQLFERALSDEPAIAARLQGGDYEPLRSWLAHHVHQHGRRYGRDELLVKATGRPLDPKPYIAYLGRKYGEVYGFGG
jgi:carboxypeptidase Taq